MPTAKHTKYCLGRKEWLKFWNSYRYLYPSWNVNMIRLLRRGRWWRCATTRAPVRSSVQLVLFRWHAATWYVRKKKQERKINNDIIALYLTSWGIFFQVKTIKFKNTVVDIAVNRFAIAVVFVERIAVFDLLTVDDIITITTCYPSPGIKSNPISLGTRLFLMLLICNIRPTGWPLGI